MSTSRRSPGSRAEHYRQPTRGSCCIRHKGIVTEPPASRDGADRRRFPAWALLVGGGVLRDVRQVQQDGRHPTADHLVVLEPELLKDLPDVLLHRTLGEEQGLRDGRVALALGHAREDLSLAG